MSGETEASVSGWTVDTLREHLTQRLIDQGLRLDRQIIDQRDSLKQQISDLQGSDQQHVADMREMLNERYATQTKALDAAFLAQQTAMRTALEAAEKAVATALTSAEKAVAKAEVAADKRFESVNEFRQQLSDQTATFMPRIEYDSAHKGLMDRLNASSDRIAALELRLTSRLDRSQGSLTGSADTRTEQRLNINQIIAVLAIVASVAIGILLATRKLGDPAEVPV